MHTIWEVIRDGNAKERLAVIADLVTIVGISLASIVAAIFTFDGRLDIETVFGMSIIGLLSLAGYSIVLAVFLVISFYLSGFFEEFKTFRSLLLFALWTLFVALTLWVGYFAYSVLVHTTFVRQ